MNEPLPIPPPVINQDKDQPLNLTKPQKKIIEDQEEKNADQNKDETPAKKEELPLGNQNIQEQEVIDQKKSDLNPMIHQLPIIIKVEDPIIPKKEEDLNQSQDNKEDDNLGNPDKQEPNETEQKHIEELTTIVKAPSTLTVDVPVIIPKKEENLNQSQE